MAEARYYRVSPKFWTDPMVLGWDDDTRLLALYLLTCPHRTTEGLFRLPCLYAQADLGWDQERFHQGFKRLQVDGFIEWDDRTQVVLILKALQWQSPENPNQVKAAVKQLAMVPDTPLKARFRALSEQYCERLAEGLPEGFGEGLPEGMGDPPSPSPSPSPEEPSSPDGDADAARKQSEQEARATAKAEATARFEQHFWPTYPKMPNGTKPEKGKALQQWLKLTHDQQQRAFRGARNLAEAVADDQTIPKHAHRFLRQSAGEFPFDDWQAPPTTGGRPPPPVTCPDCHVAIANHDDETCELVKAGKL